ncbi:MAG: 4Fe-4S dicluster domain-containing protein, partial [Actinobacteria bacterium]|nr:4Fe-4S dicluster domain-containing protein [Actinomycetota bacterium]
PCREGLRQMIYIYDRIMSGNGTVEDLKMLEDLCVLLEGASLCALGQTAHNIVVTTLKFFREEYEAHIYYNACPAKVCKSLIHYSIDSQSCTGCRLCVKSCSAGAISGEAKKPHIINQVKCTKCGACFEVCPDKFGAIIKLSGQPEEIRVSQKVSQPVM